MDWEEGMGGSGLPSSSSERKCREALSSKGELAKSLKRRMVRLSLCSLTLPSMRDGGPEGRVVASGRVNGKGEGECEGADLSGQ